MPTDSAQGSFISLQLLNGRNEVAGVVIMNMAQAEDLLMLVSGAVQAVRP